MRDNEERCLLCGAVTPPQKQQICDLCWRLGK